MSSVDIWLNMQYYVFMVQSAIIKKVQKVGKLKNVQMKMRCKETVAREFMVSIFP
jgi:hypothetical protein